MCTGVVVLGSALVQQLLLIALLEVAQDFYGDPGHCVVSVVEMWSFLTAGGVSGRHDNQG